MTGWRVGGRGQGRCPLTSWLPTFLQLLWDLELLTGAGLGLFWPSWTRFWYQRHQAQHTRSQYSQPLGRMGGNSEQQVSEVSRGTCGLRAMVEVREMEGLWPLETDSPAHKSALMPPVRPVSLSLLSYQMRMMVDLSPSLLNYL